MRKVSEHARARLRTHTSSRARARTRVSVRSCVCSIRVSACVCLRAGTRGAPLEAEYAQVCKCARVQGVHVCRRSSMHACTSTCARVHLQMGVRARLRARAHAWMRVRGRLRAGACTS